MHYGVPFVAALQYSFGKSAHFLSFSFMFFHFPSFSFIFLHCFFPFFFFLFFFFLGCSKSSFFASIASRFLTKTQVKIFFGLSRRVPQWALFFFLLSIFLFFFTFVFFFNFFPCFSFFLCFPLLSFIFLLFSLLKKMFLPFSCCFSFFFSRVPKICGGTPGFFGEKCTF